MAVAGCCCSPSSMSCHLEEACRRRWQELRCTPPLALYHESYIFVAIYHISNMSLPPHLRRALPLAGNQAAIGHDLLNDTAQRPNVLKAIISQDLFLAGPYMLRQVGLQPLSLCFAAITIVLAVQVTSSTRSSSRCIHAFNWAPMGQAVAAAGGGTCSSEQLFV